MEDRDLTILRHVGLYRITLRPVLERVIFEGRSCGAVLQRLRSEGLLQVGKFPRNVSYYQLTPKATAILALPVSRATPFGAQALHTHLAVLWFCCMGQARRFRLEPEKLGRLFPKQTPSGDHCLDEEKKDKPRIYRLYAPDAHAATRNVVREIRASFHESTDNRELDKWVEAHRYAFAILVETPERRAALKAALKATYEGDRPLTGHAYFRVEVVPGLTSIASMFRKGEGS